MPNSKSCLLAHFFQLFVYYFKYTDWKLALRVPWNESTPALVCDLKSNSAYFMLQDFNQNRMHGVLPGDLKDRFSVVFRNTEV